MRTPRAVYPTEPIVYACELTTCPCCGAPLQPCGYVSGRKTVQTLTAVQTVAQRPKRCPGAACPAAPGVWPSAQWQHLAPRYGTYGYDVIAQVGWQRQTDCRTFAAVHRAVATRVQISEAQVRYLYHQQYLPLLACAERAHLGRLGATAHETGLLLSLDGLAPEGGEPQLWVVRELQTGVTLRAGWLSRQEQQTFEGFLAPVAALGLPVVAVLSDKQQGLPAAVATVFPTAKHAFCQVHYLQNAARPVAEADEALKVTVRKAVRKAVGDLIRPEQVAAAPGVLTVTGLVPSPLPAATPPSEASEATSEREALVQDLLRRVRYLLTLKARPPLRLAGIELVERLTEVVACLDRLLRHQPEARLARLRQGLAQALAPVEPTYQDLRAAADGLLAIAAVLEPEGQPTRSGAEVRAALWDTLDQIDAASEASPRRRAWAGTIRAVSERYAPGLFHTYDVPGLPRTNNARESEFREVTRRLVRTTGQKGAVRRLLQRDGAWELLSRPPSLEATIAAFVQVPHEACWRERQRVRQHRRRFRLHVRSAKQATAQLRTLEQRWAALSLPRPSE